MEEIKKALVEADPFASWWPFVLAGIVFVVGTIRTYMGGQVCPNDNTISDQVIVVTGASGGIGRELCRELVRRNVRQLVLGCRNTDHGAALRELLEKEAANCQVEILPLDLQSFASVRRFVRRVQELHWAVDALVNCAGVIFHSAESTSDGFEPHMQCNFLSHFLLSQLLRPQLSRSQYGGRVVNVSAHGYTAVKIIDRNDPLNLQRRAPTSQRDAFALSKLAIVLASRVMAKKFAGGTSEAPDFHYITVNCCSPGLVRGTGHLRHSPIMKALFAKVLTYPWMWLFMKSPTQGAQTIVRLVTDPKLATTSGNFFIDCEPVELSELAKDKELAELVYKHAMEVIGLAENE